MKTDYETTRIEVITTSDGTVFKGNDVKSDAHNHERKILAQSILRQHEFKINHTNQSILLECFDDLIEAFHKEGVLTDGFGKRDDF